jgi:hypothetical protein
MRRVNEVMGKTPNSQSKKVSIREGYQGKPLPVGAKPPKGPAASVPVKTKSTK